uniref:TcpQ domain-containing protein n=1 Tax=Cupriavidus gilardii TaxID=82541 RepID=UPI0024792778|nr:TcpQ domain-containing protein [Cupriavidus gilardii]WDE72712.1 hypothetical protein [Cupriavidus gilardii]
MTESKRWSFAAALCLATLCGAASASAATDSVDLVAKRRTTAAEAMTALEADASTPAPQRNPGVAGIAIVPANDPATARSAASEPTIPSPPAPSISITKAPSLWEIRSDDTSLATVLDRWAREAGYRFRWTAPREQPAFPLAIRGSFEDALKQIMSDTRSTQYPLRACIYLNRTVRVIHASQSCTR